MADVMREAATTAILPRLGKLRASESFEKTPGEIVTVADHESELILSERLLGLLPQAEVVGEEACATNPVLLDKLSEPLVWIVDPLDGTPNFAAGRAPFGIIIALAEKGTVLAGWLYDPLEDRLCFAARGGGAWISYRGGKAERLRAPPPSGRPIAALATQFMPEPLRETLIAAAADHYELRPIPRCAAEHYPRLCLGENHIALFQRTLPWDHAASALLLEEAGGQVRRWSGRPYQFDDYDVGILAATSGELWESAANILLGDATLLDHAREAVGSLEPRSSSWATLRR
ncbi:inositol monophosphatase family protein [Sphingomonas sp.]|uniref:inositol monophosphatase family protein n=1 Tax=Sphingomonas sp. TaxID=28214 RepID=UPI0038B342CA